MGYKQRNKKKGNKNYVKNKTINLNHQEKTPQQKKFLTAQKIMTVQKMLGRPIKKYNLLLTREDGDWFSSEDDLKDGFIMSVFKKLALKYPQGCANWFVMYAMKSHDLKDNQRFFMYAKVGTGDGEYDKDIDMFEWFTWKELIE